MIKEDRFCSLMLCKSRIIAFLVMQTFIFSSEWKKGGDWQRKVIRKREVNMPQSGNRQY